MAPLIGESIDVTAIIVALLAAGLLTYMKDGIKYFRDRKAKQTPSAIEAKRRDDAVQAANNSVVVAIKSNAMLVADAERYRKEITEKDARHDAERENWRREMDALRASHFAERANWFAEKEELRKELDDMERRWREALNDLIDFRTRMDSKDHD